MIRFLHNSAVALLAGPMAFLSFFVGLLLLAIGSVLGLASLSFFVFALWWLFLWGVMHDADAPKYFFEALLSGFIPSTMIALGTFFLSACFKKVFGRSEPPKAEQPSQPVPVPQSFPRRAMPVRR